MLSLRNYQVEMIAKTRQAIHDGHRAILIQSPTGSGKTAIAAHVMSGAAAKGKRVWFVCHRREILQQSVATIEESAGVSCGVVAAGCPVRPMAQVQVCSIQTLTRRIDRIPKPDMIIWDECHHQASVSWSAIAAKLQGCIHIGLSATPARLDGQGLGKHYSCMIQGPSVADLIRDGYLSPYKLYAPSRVDLGGVHTVAGDYNRHELDHAMRGSTVTGDAVVEYKQRCMGKRAILFLWSVQASAEMAVTFQTNGIPARHIDGDTPEADRDQAVRWFRAGRILALCNVDLVGEGFDLPAIEACFLLRPTQSTGLYLQQVGRSLRPFLGKDYALIFDHAGNCLQHGLPDDPREWSLAGQERGAKQQECPVRQCMKCFAVMPATAIKCRECGWYFDPKPRKVRQEKGELQELTPESIQRVSLRREQGKANSYEALVAIERQRGYKAGWARHVWAARESRQGLDETE